MGTVQEPANGQQGNTMVNILFDRPNIDLKEFEAVIADKFGVQSILKIDRSHPAVTHLMLRIDDMEMMCSYMPFPFPKGEWDLSALLAVNHYITLEEQEAIKNQQSFCLVTEIGGGKTLEGKRAVCILLTRLCGALLAVDGAAGVYYSMANLLLGKNVYLKYTAIAEQQRENPDFFPVLLWILVYAAHAEDKSPTIETLGLKQFGFLELQFYQPTEEWAQSYEKLYIMSTLQISGKEVYRNRDTICFTADSISVFKQSGEKLAVIGGI